jgi:hypothetical protein
LNHLVTKSRTREVLDNREMARIFEHWKQEITRGTRYRETW